MPASLFGVLPLCYVSWLVYATYLVCKVVYIFKTEIANLLNPQDLFGPQLLKVSIATSTVIFILLVAAHNDAEKSSQRGLAIKALCTGTAFELLDSMTFLSILIVRESHLILPFMFENFVLAFACITFFLPSIGLYQLCLSDFGQHDKPLDLSGISNLSHLVFVNLPYLSVRIYLWSGFGSDISMFVLKNVISVVWNLKDIVPELIVLHRQCRSIKTAVTVAPKRTSDEFVELEHLN